MINFKARLPRMTVAATMAILCLGAAVTAQASSHREAPFITNLPKVDGTDFYMFRSYGQGADSNTVTLIANYQPLQDAYGGPNYFTLDEDAIYEIHIDNDGDAIPDITFRFDFNNVYQGLAIDTATGDKVVNTTVPLFNIAPVPSGTGLNVKQKYTVTVINGDPTNGNVAGKITHANGGGSTFIKPVDNIGMKSIPNYVDYIRNGNGGGGFIYQVQIPGCAGGGTAVGKLFVGQRAEGFVVNLGETFDLINVNGTKPPVTGITNYTRTSDGNILASKNITSLALQVPSDCLTSAGEPSIGGWTTASLPQARVLNPTPGGYSDASFDGGPYVQLSRLGMPLVNEVVIGLDKKNAFNASEPKGDAQFLQFVKFPTLPKLVEILFGVPAPSTPRTDLVATFLTGLSLTNGQGKVVFSNQVGQAKPSEMLRLNTSIPPKPLPQQKTLGLLACDLAGFPNGRRPIDDVVDIELTVAEGALTPNTGPALQTCAVATEGPPEVINKGVVVTDGALPDPDNYLTRFPYLDVPQPGSPTGGQESVAAR